MSRSMTQSEHEAVNRREYPGTRQLCEMCGEPTGRCEDDAIFTGDGEGPLCEECYDTERDMETRIDTSRTYTITLNEREAEWLRAYAQNYPFEGEESTEEYNVRKALFEALTPDNKSTDNSQ